MNRLKQMIRPNIKSTYLVKMKLPNMITQIILHDTGLITEEQASQKMLLKFIGYIRDEIFELLQIYVSTGCRYVMSVLVRVCVHVFMCSSARERARGCVCVCERERERR
jgi:hypothetical protein